MSVQKIISSNLGSFPPPTDIRLVDIHPGQITFNWTDVAALCQSLYYNIISYNCGRCPSVTSNTTVTCTDVVASGQVCTLSIQTAVCDDVFGNLSNPISVILKGIDLDNLYTFSIRYKTSLRGIGYSRINIILLYLNA